MGAFWVTFQGRRPACVESRTRPKARALAKQLTGCDVLTCRPLPYPAEPRLNVDTYKTSSGHTTRMPSFCLNGDECAGCSSCPRDYACSE